MTTDLELLVMAAKAAAFEVIGNDAVRGVLIYTDGQEIWWNPLADDGDALRLAVKRKMAISTHVDDSWAQIYIPEAGGWITVKQRNWGAPAAAMRRAIVRLAAKPQPSASATASWPYGSMGEYMEPTE